MDFELIGILLLMGAVGGFAAGLLGIGGGMILVPFITMIFTARGFAPEVIVPRGEQLVAPGPPSAKATAARALT